MANAFAEGFLAVIAGRRRTRGQPVHYRSPVEPGLSVDFASAAAEDVDLAVNKAAEAQAVWSELTPAARRQALGTLADLISADAEAIGLLDCQDMGKPISVATQEAHIAAFIIRWYAECIDKQGGFVAASSPDALSFSVRRPYGVVGSLISWNYPVINAAMKIGPALAAGNALVLKPSEIAPRSALAVGDLAAKAGLPDGLLCVLPGAGETGGLLCRHPKIAMLAFTGSTATASRVALAAAERIVPAIIEAGGKNPIVVCDDVTDIDGMARDAIAESYANSGQLCVARSKILVPRKMQGRVEEALAAAAQSFAPGPALDKTTLYGPLSGAAHAAKIASAVADAERRGEAILYDGRPKTEGDLHYAPTVLSARDGASPLLSEEYFGPVLAVAPYDTLEDAIAVANGGGYGLAATIWTGDIARARALSPRLACGHVKVKAVAGQDSQTGMALPIEPAGRSGYGTEFGIQALESYTRRQAIEYIGRAS